MRNWLQFLFLTLLFAIHANSLFGQQPKSNFKLDTLFLYDDGTYAPYSFRINDNENEAAGIIVDIWKLWSKKTHIPIKYRYFPSFKEAIQHVESGEKGVVSSICPKYRNGLYKLIYSNQYYTVKAQPIVKKEKEIIFKSLHEGNFLFGTSAGDVTNLIIQHEYPNISLKPISGHSAMIDSLLMNKVSGLLLDVYSAPK
ncbi:MAG TPA: transporter substrate-binding domain-containing protein [Chitinophagaceae bacterium]|nr:transporter substrate-binding domain-containing protein [Chitinophagaceae bacterium]